jgi:hypothetical protein
MVDTLIPFLITVSIYRLKLPTQVTVSIVTICMLTMMARIRPHFALLIRGLRRA